MEKKKQVFLAMLLMLVAFALAISGWSNRASAEEEACGALYISNFRLWVNDAQVLDTSSGGSEETAPTVKDGDTVRIALDWSIVNNQTDESGQKIYDFTAELDTQGVILTKDSDDLYIDGVLVGTYELEETSFVIHLDKEAVANKSNLCGGALLDAVIALDADDTLADGSLQTVGAGDKTFLVIYDSGSGSGNVSLSKSAVGSITYEDGVYYQNYKVQLTAKGKVTDIVMTDTSSDALTLDPGSLSVTPSDGVSVDAESFTLGFPDNTKKKDSATYTITYRMAIGDSAMENYTRTGNTVQADYVDMNGEPKSTSKTVYITPKKPSIKKLGGLTPLELDSYDGTVYMNWSIQVDLGTREQELTEEEKANIMIEDDYYAPSTSGPPFSDMTYFTSYEQDAATGMYVYKQQIPLWAFNKTADGIYTYEYVTSGHVFNHYNAYRNNGSTIYTNTASAEPFNTPITATAQLDTMDLVNPKDMLVKEPVSITYVDADGNEQVTTKTDTTATTYQYALVEWQVTVDFGKIPGATTTGPTQWNSFVIRDALCGTDGNYNGYHSFNCNCNNGHNPGTCPECDYCSLDYMNFQIVDTKGNVVKEWDIDESYSAPFGHNAVTIEEDSWSMNVINTLNSGNPYGTFYDMTNNDYKLVITYKTLVDTEALAKAGGGGELLNAATVEADYCGKIIKESGIKDASNPDAGDNWASVSIQVKGTQAETPTLQNLRKQAVTSSDIVTIGDKTYSYTYDNYLGWYLRIDKDQLAEGSTLVIHDTPTSALTYVADSAIVYDGKSFTKGIHLLDGVTVTQNEDGTIDFNYGTISQALLANANNAPYIYILYQTKLDEETWYKQTATGASASYSNIAEAIYNGESKVKAMSNGTVKAPEVVQKSGVLNQDNQKQLIGADYTIEINKNAADLGYGAETLHVVDTMAASFNLNRMSIKVYEDSIAEENQIKDYTMKYDMATNQITFRVPNKMHVLITYSVVIDVDPIDNPLWYVDTTNSVQVEAFVVDQSKSSVNFASSAADIKVWAYNTNGDITIYKYWNNGEAMTALPGATFRLYSVYDNNGHMYTEADEDYIIKDNITITESDGTITISDLPLDRIYRLQETSSPEGYEKGEDYYFVLQGHYGVTVPEALADKEVAVYESGDTISYENKPSTTEEGSTEAASSETSTETESSTESTTATEAGTTQSETTEKAAPEASTSGATTTEQAVEASPSTGDPAPILAAFLTLLAGAMGILISISKKKRKG